MAEGDEDCHLAEVTDMAAALPRFVGSIVGAWRHLESLQLDIRDWDRDHEVAALRALHGGHLEYLEIIREPKSMEAADAEMQAHQSIDVLRALGNMPRLRCFRMRHNYYLGYDRAFQGPDEFSEDEADLGPYGMDGSLASKMPRSNYHFGKVNLSD